MSVERQHAGLGGNADQQDVAGQRLLHPPSTEEASWTWIGKKRWSFQSAQTFLEDVVSDQSLSWSCLYLELGAGHASYNRVFFMCSSHRSLWIQNKRVQFRGFRLIGGYQRAKGQM